MRRPERDHGPSLEPGLWPEELVFAPPAKEGEIPEETRARPSLAEVPAAGTAAVEQSAESGVVPEPPTDPELGGAASVAESGPAAPVVAADAAASESISAAAPGASQAPPAEPATRRIPILDELFPPAYAGVPVR